MIMLRWLLTGMICTVLANLAHAQESGARLALVIAQTDYSEGLSRVDLAATEADTIEAALRTTGFSVTRRSNLTKQALRSALDDFRADLERAGEDAVGFVYYTGHGAQHPRTRNSYLLGTDTHLDVTSDLVAYGVDLETQVESFAATGAKAVFLVFDACRNLPSANGFKANVKGLARVNVESGVLVAYSTSLDSVAEEGIYAPILAEEITRNGRLAGAAFEATQIRVAEKTGQTQLPWTNNLLYDAFCFNTCDSDADVDEAELAAWVLATRLDTPDSYAGYLKRYPAGRWASTARQRNTVFGLSPKPAIRVGSYRSGERWTPTVQYDLRKGKVCGHTAADKLPLCPVPMEVAWSPDGATLALLLSDQRIEFWKKASTGTGLSYVSELKTPDGAPRPARDIAWHPSGKMLALAGADGIVYLYALSETDGWKLQDQWDSGGMWTESVDWSQSGQALAISDTSGHVSVLALDETRHFQATPQTVQSQKKPGAVQYSPDGQYLSVDGFNDWKYVALFTVDNGVLTSAAPRLMDPHRDWIKISRWSPDGSVLATSSFDDRIVLNKVAENTRSSSQAVALESDSTLASFNWHPDGTRIAASDDDELRVWGKAPGADNWESAILAQIDDIGEVGITWNPQGDILITYSDEGIVQLWTLAP